MRVVKYPHPILRYACKPLRKIDQGVRDIVAEMFELMYENRGVGLAANQVELPYQLVVLNQTGDPDVKEEEYVLINPIIGKMRGRVEGEEGCLSFPDLHMNVTRADEVEFQAINLKGELCSYRWKGFQARIVQHETDHLKGRCFYQQASEAAQIENRWMLDEMAECYATELERGFEPSPEQVSEAIAKWESERC
ncbi:MAG: peptide deformylase [Thermoguttaceae bacterium]|nr:peptide deformylase [Thermoguttaceae bacterium]